MRILPVLTALLVFSGSIAFAAEETPCAESFRKAHADYFARIEGLQSDALNLKRSGVVIGAGGLFCLYKTRSITLCAGVLGAAFVGSQAYRYRVLGQIKQLEDSYKIYEMYYAITRENYGDESLQKLFLAVEARAAQERRVSNELKKMVDSGELCAGGNVPALSYDEMIDLLIQRKGQD